jgi:ABC-2 type transport system permease protein
MQSKYWLRPVFSVVVKEVKIITRYRTWFIATFIWPVIYPLTFYFLGKGLAGTDGQGLKNFEQLANTSEFASFLILGNLVWMFVNLNIWMGGLSVQMDRMRGTFDTHWTMPVSKLSLVIGGTIASLILNFLPMIAAISLYALLGAFKLSGNFLSILVSIFIIMPFLIGFLIIFAALTIRLRQANLTVQIVRNVLSILCGMQFPLAVLPKTFSGIAKYIPLTHFVDMIRGIVIHRHSLSNYKDSIIFILLSGIVMLVIGIFVFNLIIKNVKKGGLATGY